MDLSKVFSPVLSKFGQKNEQVEHFLAVKLSESTVFSAVWTIDQSRVKIGKVASEKITDKTFEELLKAVDRAVSGSSAETPEVSKVIFAVPLESIVEGKIIPEELTRLRKLCKELDLFPLGYVVVAEALEQYFKEIEGSPLSAILVGLDGKDIGLSLFKAGREISSATIKRSEGATLSLAAEIEKGLKQFGHTETLPSRIILYDGDSDLTALASEITAYPWTGRLPFLHFPKVEKVPSDFVVTAVAAAGGLQMGGKLAPIETEPVAELLEVSPEEAGFTTTNEEIRLETISTPVEPPVTNKQTTMKEKIKTLAKKLSFLGFPKLAILIPGLVILLGAVVGALLYAIPQVRVIAVVDSQEFNREMVVGVETAGSADVSGDKVAGTFVETTLLGTKRGVAMGQKLVGAKAKGTVTIYSVTEGKAFLQGTVITSPTGLKLTLEKEVSVASGDAVSAATVTVPVEATAIGDSFNLGAGTKFSVENFSSSLYLAKNESAFSGGESHMATVVTSGDQDRLMASLSAELSEKALVDLQSKVESNQTLLPKAVTAAVAKKKFSKDIDSEADNVSLDLTMDFKGVVFSEDEVLDVFREKFGDEIPEGYMLVKSDTKVSVVEAKTDKNKNTVLTLRIKSSLVPKTDQEKIVSEIIGKDGRAAANIISRIPGVTKVQFEVTPRLVEPLLQFSLPWKRENIKVVIVRE